MVGRSWRILGLSGVAGLAGLSGCGSDDGDRLVVAAATSLTAAFTEIGAAYEDVRPDVEVTFNFAASSEIAAQVLDGAPVDVFAAADLVTMDRVAAAGETIGHPVVFATNRPTIVVEPGNPRGIDAVDDLAEPDLIVVVCAPEVPCGRYASSVVERAGLVLEPSSLEENVKAVVTKVALGEADAGIAYTTDVVAAGGDVDGVSIPAEINVVAEYPIAVVGEDEAADDAARGRDFLDFVRSDDGRTILADHGFGSP